jgi:hypothetical protein
MADATTFLIIIPEKDYPSSHKSVKFEKKACCTEDRSHVIRQFFEFWEIPEIVSRMKMEL